MADPLIVACVLKSGGDFDAEYVERLWEGVRRHLKSPHRFVCLSDVDVPCDRIELKYDLPGWWSKMELFRPDISGDILYIDLDTIIVGDLGPLTDMSVPRMLRGGVSSIMSLPMPCRGGVWEEWIKNPRKHMRDFGNVEDRTDLVKRCAIGCDPTDIGDQSFIRRLIKYKPYHERYLCSYEHVAERPVPFAGPTVISRQRSRPPIPRDVAAIIFSYHPRPKAVNWLA